MTPFRRVYVQSAAGDAGGAIGAAFALWHRLGGKRTFVMNHAYWGPEFDAEAIAKIVKRDICRSCRAAGFMIEEITDEIALCNRAAAAIAEGQVVGWFQGRMEWGPRALGNRSISGRPSARRYESDGSMPRSSAGNPFDPSRRP